MIDQVLIYDEVRKEPILIESAIVTDEKLVRYLAGSDKYEFLSLGKVVDQCLKENVIHAQIIAKILPKYKDRIFLIVSKGTPGIFYRLKNIFRGDHGLNKPSGVMSEGKIYINLGKLLGETRKDFDRLEKFALLNIVYVILHELVHLVCFNSNTYQKMCSNLIMTFYNEIISALFKDNIFRESFFSVYKKMHLVPENSHNYEQYVRQIFISFSYLVQNMERRAIGERIERDLVKDVWEVISALVNKDISKVPLSIVLSARVALQNLIDKAYEKTINFSKTMKYVIFGQELVFISEFLAVATSMAMLNVPDSVRLLKKFVSLL